MHKISFRKKEGSDHLFILINSENPLTFDDSKNEADVLFKYDFSRKLACIKIDFFFVRYLKKKDLKIILSQIEKQNFIIDYDSQDDTLSFYYEKTKDIGKFICKIKYYRYEIGKETITRIDINKFSAYWDDESIEKELFTKKIQINEEEKETIEHYIGVLKRYEENFKEEKKEKIRKAKLCLEYIQKSFPLISGIFTKFIEEQLKDFSQFPELEECVINIKEMQRKKIALEPLEEELKEDETEEYIDQYRDNRDDLISTFDDEQIKNIPVLESQKLQEAKKKIGRLRRILEVRRKSAKPSEKVEIEKYIIIIKRFETKTLYLSKEEKKKTLDNLLDVLGGISVFVGDIPRVIIDSIIKVIKAIRALIDLSENYKKQKKEKREKEDHETFRKSESHEETFAPIYQKRTLKRQPRPVQVRDWMKVEIVEKILRQHGPLTIIGIQQVARNYNYIITKEQIQGAVYSSDRFYAHGKRKIYKGIKAYNVYHVRK